MAARCVGGIRRLRRRMLLATHERWGSEVAERRQPLARRECVVAAGPVAGAMPLRERGAQTPSGTAPAAGALGMRCCGGAGGWRHAAQGKRRSSTERNGAGGRRIGDALLRRGQWLATCRSGKEALKHRAERRQPPARCECECVVAAGPVAGAMPLRERDDQTRSGGMVEYQLSG